VGSNIKLIEAHILQSLNRLSNNVSEEQGAWENFENKFGTITIVNQVALKTKSVKTKSTSELNLDKINLKWLWLLLALIGIGVALYLLWPKIQSWNATSVEPKIDSALIQVPKPVISAPPPIVSPSADTVKKDTIVLSTLPTPNKITVPSAIINRPAMNKTTVNSNTPKSESPIETKPKEEANENKKTEGEFDFFDKPSVKDSLRPIKYY
jgi:hypothetical protein